MIAAIIPIGIGGIVFFALWFWAILDCIATDSILVRNLPKQMWLMLVILVPTAGALAWLLLGRPANAGFSVGGNFRPPDYTQRQRSRGIEDSLDWQQRSREIPKATAANAEIQESNDIKERRLLEWEAELEKREAALDDDAGDLPDSGD